MSGRTIWTPAFVVALLVLVSSAVALTVVIQMHGYYLTKLSIYAQDDLQFHSLPHEYPSWERVGSDHQMSKEAVDELGTQNYLSRTCLEKIGEGEDRSPHLVDLHIAYYTGMIDTVPHVPERCLVAAGLREDGGPWIVDVPIDVSLLVRDPDTPPELLGGTVWMGRSPTAFRRIRLPVGVDELKMRVSRFINSQGQTIHAGYFFIANGGTKPSADDIRLLAFRLEDDYAYYTKVQFTSPTVSSAEDLALVAAGMLDEMFPDIMRRVPDWVEVKEGRYPAPRNTDPGETPRGESGSERQENG